MHLMDLIRPQALKKGDTIGIIAPSSFIESDKLDIGVEVLRNMGFKVKIHPQTFAREHQSAGSISEKVSALHELFIDTEVNAIMAAGGGNRSAHILDSLDYKLMRSNPKLFIGFSDTTAVLSALAEKAGLISLHGPVVKSLTRLTQPSLEFLSLLLSGKTPHYPFEQAIDLHDGTGSGPLIGGNLGSFCSLIGTGYMPSAAGAILFLEDINEELSRVDRILWNLRKAMPFSALKGIVFGQFSQLQDTGRPFGYTLEDILREHVSGLDIPVAMNAPFGHEADFYALPVGSKATLDVSAGDVALHLNAPPLTL